MIKWKLLFLALIFVTMTAQDCTENDVSKINPTGYCQAWCGEKRADPDCIAACRATLQP